MLKKLRLVFLYFFTVFFVWYGYARSRTAVDLIESSIKSRLPKLSIDKITKTPVSDIYEVRSNKKVFYIDVSGRYLFVGNLVDLFTHDNLTQIAIESMSFVNWGQLPLNVAIRHVNGDGRRKIAIFTDPDCPFCKRLEEETVPSLKNVTIYYFLFPLEIHVSATDNSKKILCSKTPEITYLNWMRGTKPLPEKNQCDTASNLQVMLDKGRELGVEATPTIVLPDGKIVTGLIPADYLNQLITNAQAESSVEIESKVEK